MTSIVAPVSNMRVAVDWDNDLFICYDAVPADALNVMHTGLSSTPGLVNLHWNYINKSAISGAAVSWATAWTDYGVREFHVVTGTDTGAGGYFGWTGSGDADIHVTSSAAYTAVMWIKATVGSGTSMKLDMLNSTDSVTFTISGSWQKVTLNFTPSANLTGFKIYKNNSATDVTFDATGFMVVAGSTAPGGFNVGSTTCRYDVLDGVNKCDLKIGQRDWSKRWMDEGSANIRLNNFDRTYSPEYSSSPLYGAMGAKQLLTVDAQATGESTWTRMFSGWIESILPDTVKTGTRKVLVKAVQGRFQLDKIPFNQLLSGTVTVDDVIELVLLGGYVSAATPIQASAGFSSAGACYASDTAAMYALDTGVSEIPVNPESWGGDNSASRVLQDLLKIEQGWFFINRSGKVMFYNRHHYSDPALAPSPTSIDADTQATTGEYEFAKPYYNTARVTYHPSSSRVDTIWESRETIQLQRWSRKKITAKFEYTEGKKITVTAVNAFDGTADASTITLTGAPASLSSQIGTDVKLENGQAQIQIRNHSRRNVGVYIILKGTIQESAGGSTIERESEAPGIGGPETLKENLKQIATEDEANNFAAYMLDLFRKDVGGITAFTMLSRDAATFGDQLAISLGDMLTVTQYQTGHTGSYTVVGEEHRWSAEGVLESTYYLFPLHRLRDVWILGTSELGSSTYLAY